MARWWVAIVAAVALVGSLLSPVAPAQNAVAADGSQFNAGNIISDAIFFDGQGLSASGVQNLLNSKVSSCRSGYTCLKSYSQATPSISSDSYCSAYSGSGSESAANIIAKVGAACGINPKVLLVLLEKEQSLVSDTWPEPYQYRNATGFSCPDTAPCDPAFSGFFYQVFYAARQFKKYAATPGNWRYKAGQNNQILYHPNTACGSSTVFIQNQATAGLYIYTPYQPNGPAMGNLYGTGDSCSAYGNRNFWRIFTDWFGSTIATSLVRTPEDSTVYLIASGKKYYFSDMSTLSAYNVFGGVSTVSQSYVNSIPAGHKAGRIVRGTDGSIYFVDNGARYSFSNCSQVADFGGACSADSYIQLDDAQMAVFRDGSSLNSRVQVSDQEKYWITSGTKREILNNESAVANNIPGNSYTTLSSAAVNSITTGLPIISNGVFAKVKDSGSLTYLNDGKRYEVSSAVAQELGFASKTVGQLSPSSLQQLTSGGSFTGIVSVGGNNYALSASGKYPLASTMPPLGVTPVPVTQSLVDSYPNKQTIERGSFIKQPNNGTIYIVMGDSFRPISSWDTLVAISRTPQITYFEIPKAIFQSYAEGRVALTGGRLYRSEQDATVYFINGLTTRIALQSFVFTMEAGFTQFAFANHHDIVAYPNSDKLLTFGATCGTTSYVAAGGSLHKVPAGMENLYPFVNVAFDEFTCMHLKIGKDANEFIKTPDGTYYQLVGGQKRPVSSIQRFNELSGGRGYLNVHPWFANSIPNGPPA